MGFGDPFITFSIFGFSSRLLVNYLLIAYIVINWAATAVYNIYFHPLRHFPGPKIWLIFPIWRHIDSIAGIREHKILAYHEKHGPVVRSAPDTLIFTDPQAWSDIYGHGHPELPKAYGRPRIPVPDILFADTKTHARYRRALLPAFSDKALGEQQELIKVYIDLLMKRLRELAANGQAADMTKWFNFTTFDLIGDLTFGEPLGGLESNATNVWMERIRKAIRLLPVTVALREHFSGLGPLMSSLFKRSQRQHQAMVKSLVQRRIRNAEYGHRGDFMDQMMRGRGKDEQLTDDELTVNADVIMVAGSETTATLLTGVVYFLLANPDKLARLQTEIRSAFVAKDDITVAGVTSKLPFLLACLNEALRLYPPVPVVLLRETLPSAPTPIAGHMVPEKVSKQIPAPTPPPQSTSTDLTPTDQSRCPPPLRLPLVPQLPPPHTIPPRTLASRIYDESILTVLRRPPRCAQAL